MAENKNKGFFAGLLDRFRKPKQEEVQETPLPAIMEKTEKPTENLRETPLIKAASEDFITAEKSAESILSIDHTIIKKSETSEMPAEAPETPPSEIAEIIEPPIKDAPAPPEDITTVVTGKAVPEVSISPEPITEPVQEAPREKAQETKEQPEKKSFLDLLKPPFIKTEKPPRPAIEDEPGTAEKKPVSWFARLKEGLDKTRKSFVFKVKGLLKLRNVIDDDFWEELEDILITADVGLKTNEFIITQMKKEVEEKLISDPPHLFDVMKEKLCGILEEKSPALCLKDGSLTVIMVVGVNGTGKTTSIAKLANRLMNEDKKVIVAAADTFRAAAIEQLEVWSRRTGLELIKHQEGADPAAVVFDALQAATARGADVLIIDTAGRLHSKVNLMKELEKIKRVIGKIVPEGPSETLLVLDATTGQNALIQAKTFSDTVDVSGIVLTKLDGTAKGGVIIGIVHELGIPVKFIGIGEGIMDLRPFEGRNFLDALFSDDGDSNGKT